MNGLPEEDAIQWRTVLIIFLFSVAIFLGGMSSGYFLFRSEYLPKAEKRDQVVNEIKQKVDQLPQQINREVREDVKK
ncbi:hypothetical protein [Pantoea vagans]|uniref:hypothetical protein n=1 Tax=Pantoea vagans TaxID=470934 RepID=UPI0030183D7C